MSDFIPDDQFVQDEQLPVIEQAKSQTIKQPASSTPINDFIPDDEFVSDEDKYNTPVELAKTTAEGLAEGVLGPIAPLVETSLGVNPEDIRARAENSPTLSGASKAIGFGGSLLAGVGLGPAVAKVGKAAQTLTGLGKAAEGVSTSAKIGSVIVREAAENAVFQGSDEISKFILKDPEQSADSVIANIGLAGVVGGVAGGAFGSVSPLWKATVGSKIDNTLNTVTGHLNGKSLDLPEQTAEAVRSLGIIPDPTVNAAFSKNQFAKEQFNILRESQNREVLSGIEKLNKDVADSVANKLGVNLDQVDNYSEADVGHELLNTFEKEFKQRYEPIAKQLQKRDTEAARIAVSDDARLDGYGKFLEQAITKVGTDSPYYKLYEDYGQRLLSKDTVGGMDMLKTEINNRLKGLKVGGDFNEINALRDIKTMISDLQEKEIMREASILDKEGVELGEQLLKERAEANKAYSEFAKISDELTNHLNIGDFQGAGSLIGKMSDKITPEQLLKKFSFKNNADFIPFLQTYFPETLQAVKQNELSNFIRPAALNAKGDMPLDVKKLNKMLDAALAGKSSYVDTILQPESIAAIRAADTVLNAVPNFRSSGTAGWMQKLTRFVPQSALAGVAMVTGNNPILGFIAGEMAQQLGHNMPNAMRLSLLKMMGTDKPVSAEGFKSMVDFAVATYKQENLTGKAIAGVFKGGSKVLQDSAIPDVKDREKLDKRVKDFTENPQAFIQSQGQSALGYYMPEHQVSMTASTTRAMQYLQSIKPQPFRSSPLDKEIPPSKAEMARYNRALDIAQEPTIVLKHIKEGTLQANDVQDLVNLYPSLYNQYVSKLTNEITAMQGADVDIPYKTRMNLSLFMGQPLDTTMLPSSIQAAQPIPQPPPPQNQKPSQSAAKAMEKSHKQYMTPLQSSESNKALK